MARFLSYAILSKDWVESVFRFFRSVEIFPEFATLPISENVAKVW